MVGASLTTEAFPIFQRYLTPPQGQILINTVIMGVLVATVGSAIGFLFAYVQVRVPLPRPLKRFMHVMALLPIVSPPFALALAARGLELSGTFARLRAFIPTLMQPFMDLSALSFGGPIWIARFCSGWR